MDQLVASKPEKTVNVVSGQLHKFMLIPIMPQHTEWIEAGPVTFGVEARVLGGKGGEVSLRGTSLHVFSADRSEEYARYDCFNRLPHYHYILNDDQHNIVWGYDPDVNGPMPAWAIGVIRNNLPSILRRARATALAERVEKEGFDLSALDKVEQALDRAWDATFPGTEMIQEGLDWMARWKAIHPQFNTVDD
jgi:hypothetical protein